MLPRHLVLRGALALSLCAAFSFPAMGLEGATPAPAGESGLTPLERLGKHIFEDKNLSRPAGVSCASCHDAATAFQGANGSPVPAVARGSKPESLGKRNTPSIMYASFAPPFGFIDDKDEETGKVEKIPAGGQFLDGRASDLLAQFEGPLLDPLEMNAPSKRFAVEAIRDGAYSALAKDVYGEKIFDDPDKAFEKMAQAVVAFESSARFHPFASKFDDYLRGKVRLTAVEQKGFELFKDPKKGNCLACHAGEKESHDPQDWLFTDFTYDALGAPKNAAIAATADAPDLGLCKRGGLDKFAPGGFDINSVCGAFKVPTLRNVAVTGPYLHNGVFTKLRDVVAFYATRDTDPARWYQKGAQGKAEKFDDLPAEYRENVNTQEVPYDRKAGEKPRLSEQEIDAITAFLETLTDRAAR
ncbi:cytochrome-c peroxidase [Methylocystis parvus]|uniref:C-type cytochrome n=1 Tax=Methylocystis parvus TaxID=134 RepID=A0A6B8M4C2_9HYPH|nr:cytochrome c peroxidase [Methylocystis parvus]QGM96609.1 c-type cytochrome [Methylocystis parvus]WBJ99535.1 c-type cytochrome [Methylocystis parvus OBBP]